MLLRRTPLLLLGAALGAFLPGGCRGSPWHSLCYSYLEVSEPSQELPQFLSMAYLDNQPIARYDNLSRKMQPLVSWIQEVEEEDPNDWMETLQATEGVFGAPLESVQKPYPQIGGLHTWQAILGCELSEDGSRGGYLHYGYNGRDFISFDKGTLRWVAAQPQAEKIKEKWDDDPKWSQTNKVFLEETCIRQLKRYLSSRKEALVRTESPVGKVTRKVVSDSLETLICQAHGFYPKEINATWMRNGKVCKYETFHRNVAPNWDGTYYLWFSIEIDPKERNQFRCHMEHVGLQKPLILVWKEEPWTRERLLPMILLTVVLLVLLMSLLRGWRCRSRKKDLFDLHQGGRPFPDSVSSERIPSVEIEAQEMLFMEKPLRL